MTMITNAERLRILNDLPAELSEEERSRFFAQKLESLQKERVVRVVPQTASVVVKQSCGSCGGGKVL